MRIESQETISLSQRELPSRKPIELVWNEKEKKLWTEKGLRVFLGLNTALGGKLIDFNLLPEDKRPKGIVTIPIEEAREHLSDLKDTLPIIPTDETTFLRSKIQSVEALVIEIERRKHGRKGPFKDVYEKTLGLSPEFVSQETINSVKEQLEECLIKANIRGNCWVDKLQEHRKLKRIGKNGNFIDGEKIIGRIKETAASNIATLNKKGIIIPDVSYGVESEEKNEYWKCWVDGDSESGFRLRINTHPRHGSTWIEGTPERYSSHEVLAHLVQMQRWHKAIKEGSLNPLMGLTTIPGPEQFQLEGFAQTIHFFAGLNWSPDTEISWLDVVLHTLAWQHTFYLYESGVSSEKAAKEYKKIYPLAKERQIRDEMERVSRNPYRRTYQDVYGPALTTFWVISQELGEKERLIFIEKMLQGPKNPQQINTIYRKILNNR